MYTNNTSNYEPMGAALRRVLSEMKIDQGVCDSIIKKLEQSDSGVLPSLYSEIAAMGTQAITFLQFLYQYMPHIVMENPWIDASRQLEIVTVRDYSNLLDSITFAKERADKEENWFILQDNHGEYAYSA